MIIDLVSDLHGFYPEMEGGDLLIVAGDCTKNDNIHKWHEFFNWLDKQDYRKKIVVAGNHDNFCKNWATSGTFIDHDYDQMYPGEKITFDYLCDSGIEFEGLKIWGVPHSLLFKGVNPDCKAFMDTEKNLVRKWAMIPSDTDILITHSPPYGVMDTAPQGDKMVNTGSIFLREALEKIQPKLHVFGHIHEGYGQLLFKHCGKNTMCVNASHVDENYRPVNKPIRIIL